MTQSLWHRARKAQFPKLYLWVLSHFMVEGDSYLLSVRTVGIMLPLSEVKRKVSAGPLRPGKTQNDARQQITI